MMLMFGRSVTFVILEMILILLLVVMLIQSSTHSTAGTNLKSHTRNAVIIEISVVRGIVQVVAMRAGASREMIARAAQNSILLMVMVQTVVIATVIRAARGLPETVRCFPWAEGFEGNHATNSPGISEHVDLTCP